jgi:hypothetical protein
VEKLEHIEPVEASKKEENDYPVTRSKGVDSKVDGESKNPRNKCFQII